MRYYSNNRITLLQRRDMLSPYALRLYTYVNAPNKGRVYMRKYGALVNSHAVCPFMLWLFFLLKEKFSAIFKRL